MQSLLKKLNQLNIKIDLLNDKLNIQAPKGAVTNDLLDEIKMHKEDLISFIKSHSLTRKDYKKIPKVEEQTSYELSSSQYRLWLLSQFQDGNIAYNMASLYEFNGMLDLISLEKALASVIDRHESLRTLFVEDEFGNVRQVILNSGEINFKLIYEVLDTDLDQGNRIGRMIDSEKEYQFDLSVDCLFRATLIKIAEDKYIFTFVMHHIISDAWSCEVMINEILLFYNANLKKISNPLPSLELQYKDYAAWQKKLLSDDILSGHKKYWLKLYENEIPVLNLPNSKNRPLIKTYNGKSVTRLFDKGLLNDINNLCLAQDSTVFMGLLTAVNVLLYRYSNQNDIIIGIPSSNREHPDLHNQIGFYVNTLPIRTQLSKNDSYRTLLKSVKKNILESYEHQIFPFDELVESIYPNRDMSRNPLFDVMVRVENSKIFKQDLVESSDIDIIQHRIKEVNFSKFDLEFAFNDIDNELGLTIIYNTDIYSEEFINKLLKHFNTLLQSIIEDIDLNLCLLEYLTEAEKNQILYGFNNSDSVNSISNTVIDLFEQQVTKTPENIAVILNDISLTYRELNEKSNQLAAFLIENYDICQDHLIGVKLEKSDKLIIVILGVLKSGAAYVPIDPNYPKNRIKAIESDSNCKLIIDEQVLIDFENHKASYSLENVNVSIGGSNLVYVIYTSGSTGIPKGIMMEHHSMVNLILFQLHQLNDCNVKRVLQFTSISFDVSFQEIFTALLSGATLYPVIDNIKKDPRELSAFIKDYCIETIFLPTSYFKELMGFKDFSELLELNIAANIIVAGEQLTLSSENIKLLRESTTKLFNHYGPAETHVVTTIELKNNDLCFNPAIGSPISNTQIYILGENLELLPVGFCGKIYISGAGVSRGYLNKEALTREKFILNPFIDAGTMYDTGDLGFWLPDGNIGFYGRKDNQVKIRGFRIELGEIEHVILKFSSSVKQVLVEAKESNNGKLLVAYIVGDTIDKTDLRVFLQERLPDYMIPSFYILLDFLPLNSNGKVNRKLLPEVIDTDIVRKDFEAPETEVEKVLVKIWQEVLRIDKIGITDNFFHLGGHSLIVGQVINRIQLELNMSVPYKVFFNEPTVKAISKELQNNSYIPIPRTDPALSYPLSSAQSRLWILSQLEEGSIAYNLPSAVELKGMFDVTKFKLSFNKLLESYDILRTQFHTNTMGEIRQNIIPYECFEFQIEIEDYSVDVDKENSLAHYIKKEIKIPFNLEKGPLLKASLIKMQDDHYVFFLSMHHIISDGWSIELLISQVIKNYNALIDNRAIILPQLTIQYHDFAFWINDAVQQEKMYLSEKYWLEQMEGELPVLNFPAFKKRPVVKTYNGEHLHHSFSKEFLSQLNKFSQQHDVTLFMTLMAGINVLLHKYSGQDDIIVGTPIAGREHPDLENQLGLFLNTLAIRTGVKKEDSFSELLKRQKEILLGAYEHQGYPFDVLVGKLNLKRDISRSALFDVLVILQNQNQLKSLSAEEFRNLEVKGYEFKNNSAKFDISFTFVESEGLDLIIEYNTDIYDASFMNGMFVHLENLLNKFVSNVDLKIKEATYLTNEENKQLLYSFNDTQIDYDTNKTIIDLFENQVQKTPHTVAIRFDTIELTYSELNDKSNQLAYYLRETYDLKPDDLVGVKIARNELMIMVLLGVLKSGAAYVPIDPNYPVDRILYIEREIESKVIIDEVEISKFVEIQDNYSKSNIKKINQSKDLAYIIYTSGTTGSPKGVMVENKSVVNFLHAMQQSISLNEKENILAITSISFDISILEIFWSLCNGNTVTLKADSATLNNFDQFLEDYSETIDFSLFYFSSQSDGGDKYKFLLDTARYADENGFSAVWLPERHFHQFGGIFPNPSVLAGALSTITENVEIRSGSVVLPLHDTIRVAEEWAVIDNLSNGRIALSIASGWHADDFVLQPQNYSARKKIMYDQIEDLKKLWTGGSIKRKNGLGHEVDVKIFPQPVSPGLDLYVTAGGSSETFKSAGAIGANILTHLLGQELKDLKRNIKIYKQALKENGFSINDAKISLMLHTFIGTDLEAVKATAKEPFKAYLKSSVGLIQNLAKDFNKDTTAISESDLDDLLNLAFERYWQTAALLGTKDSCRKIIKEIHSIGVTEIACLIDFGIDDKLVYESLKYLGELQSDYKKVKQNTSQKKQGITSMQITPSYLEALLEDENSKMFIESLRSIIVGGETFSNKLLNKLRSHTKAKIYNMYGPTETTVWSTFQESHTVPINIGKPIQNTQIYILDEDRKICPVGVAGELCIGGAGLARGYYKDKNLTEEKFIEILFPSEDIKKIYRTGDLGRWLPDGSLEHLGRLDNQVKVNGFRIELGEIESVLTECEKVEHTVALAKLNEAGNTNLIAYVVGPELINEHELRDYAKLKLPHYMVPDYIIQIDKFPLTPNGKIDRKSLPSFTLAEKNVRNYVAPRNETENRLIEIWQQLLGIERIGVNDNFFDLGGNSLLMIKMLNTVNKEFLTSITLLQGYNLPNILAMYEFINPEYKSTQGNENQKIDELYDIMEESYNLLNFDENEQ